MTAFRERNPIPIAVAGLVVLLAILYGAFNAASLPIIGGGTLYHAAFEEAGGLKLKDDVRIAGVKVGEITSIGLEGSHVRVAFRVDPGTFVGDQSRAIVRIKTLLGQMYLALDIQGVARLDHRTEIPLTRTTTPMLTVTTAFQGLSQRIDAIDTHQLATAFNTLSQTFANTPTVVRQALSGLSRVSQTIASRDERLQSLLGHAQGVTTVLASRDAEFIRLIDDGDRVLTLVEQQRDVIHSLLVDTSALSAQLSGLVAENQTRLGPALRNLAGTVDILSRDQGQLDKSIHLLAPFVRDFTNTLGNGRWFDTFVANLGDFAAGKFTVVPSKPAGTP